MTARLQQKLSLLCLAVICLGALHPLLLNPHAEYGPDWSTHIYSIGFQSEYLRQHHRFPATLNLDLMVGLPYPVLYAVVFHPFAAVLALAMGVDWAVRLIFLVVLMTQTWQVRKLLQSVGSSEALAWLAAALLAWATYAMTNLYTRGAMAEFVGASLLISATASLVRGTMSEGASRFRLLIQGAFFYALCAGTHPITGLFGGLFIAAVFTPLLVAGWRRVLAPVAGGSVMVILVLASWLYALKQFRGTLTVDLGTMNEKGVLVRWGEDRNQVVHFPESIDSITARLWPWPRDFRVEQAESMWSVSTPYLDAQVSVPLILLAMGASWWMWRRRKTRAPLAGIGVQLWGISWGLFFVAFGLSIWPALWSLVPRTLHMAQFAYRLVTYQNLALLTVVVGALVALPPGLRSLRTPGRRWRLIAWASLSFVALTGLTGLVVMSSHVAAIQKPPIWQLLGWPENSDMFARYHPGFYGWWGYSVLGTNIDTESPVRSVQPKVGLGDSFGRVQPTSFELATATNVCIQVQPFPWNRLVLDGAPLDLSQVRTRPEGYVMQLPAGAHQVAYQWQPDATWVWLDALSKFAVLGGGLVVLFWASYEALRARHSLTAPAEASLTETN